MRLPRKNTCVIMNLHHQHKGHDEPFLECCLTCVPDGKSIRCRDGISGPSALYWSDTRRPALKETCMVRQRGLLAQADPATW